jgi:ligand-binding SRPBCC domain-containing protein
MTTIEKSAIIDAPIETCFDLSLNIDLELAAAHKYDLRAITGVTGGPIGFGQRVTWQSRQFGLRIRHTSEITGFQPPVYFQDKMVRGIFKSFVHDHFFRAISPRQTEMRDLLRFGMPAIMLGRLTELLLVRRRLESLLSQRNTLIKERAERTGLP